MKLLRSLLGVPARRQNYETAIGRTQTCFGGWWDRHPVLLRGLALIALGWVTAYLVWRIGWSWRGASIWLAVPLIIAELYGIWTLTMLTWFSWGVRPSVRPQPGAERAIDVYVCTYDEPAAVLRATLTGCLGLRYPHATYLLDDGRRPEIAVLAHEFGAVYLTRSDNSHAKAGNINAALPRTAGELVLVLDADHVPLPDALDALVGYFEDEQVALVQTPHDFYNHDSVQHYEIGRHEQSVFYSVIMPGKDRHGAVFWCGSGAVIRRDALLGVGGVATQTIAEDFHTTIKLHAAGWKTRYHDEVLIQGLAPHDLSGYLLQRDRWARGNLAVFTTPESPLRASKLSAAQRLSYFASLSAYLSGPMRLVMLATLAVVLWTGKLPLVATPLTLGLLWAPAMLLSITAGAALCRGFQSAADTTHFELSTAEIFGRALRCVVRPGRTRFKVTPKHGVDLGGWEAITRLRVVCVLTAVMAIGLVVRILDDTGVAFGFLPRLHGIAIWVIPVIALCELRRLLRTLVMVGTRRQLRAGYRVPLDAPLAFTISGGVSEPMIGHGRDITPGGMSLELPEQVEPGTSGRVLLTLPSTDADQGRVPLEIEVVSCRPTERGSVVGARIIEADSTARHRILEYCFVTAPSRRLRGWQELPPPQPVVAEQPQREAPGLELTGTFISA
ncbi:MAG TPA: glycosyltransferase family 2 protein [Solirubrobacteraceae bacterium]|nr:glycosyltransferase family 2 protein [Solirubrobacteraceae bacterium]